LLDQGLARCLGHARANRQTFAHEAGIAHLVAMVVEVRPSVVNAFADLLRERTLTRQAHSLGGEYIEGIDVVLEFAAVLVQPGRTFGFGACSPYGCVSSRWKSCPGSCLFTQVVITDSWEGDRPWASSVVKVPGAWRKHRWSSRWGEQLCRP